MFANIGILVGQGRGDVACVLANLVQLLQKKGVCLYGAMLDFDHATEAIDFSALGIIKTSTIQLPKDCDLVMVVGGDGSMLRAHRYLLGHSVPILGINLGRLGFLADVLPQELSAAIHALFAGDYTLDNRFVLQARIDDWHDTALNDVVVHAGKSVHTIDLELFIDGVFVARQLGDGLIIATPTGSTAYALSAGGPIVHPKMPAICLAPMHPHTLSARPIIIDATSKIDIIAHKDNRTMPQVSADGGASVALHSSLRIQKDERTLTLIHPQGFDFFATCRTKLHWQAHTFDWQKNE